MRKNLFFVLSFVIGSSTLLSQNSRIYKSCFDDFSIGLIIKTYYNPQLIFSSYCYVYGTSYMGIRDNTSNLTIKLIRDCKVNDFVIANDTVFFCGRSSSGKGVIGYFDIADYFYNTGDYHIQEIFNMSDGYYAANLKKMVTYLDHHNTRHVFAIGYTSHNDYPNDNFGCVVDLMDANDDFSYYNTSYVNKSDSNIFEDVTLSGKYIVTSGFDFSGELNSRLFVKNSPFAPSGVQEYPVEIWGSFNWNTNESQVSSSTEDYFSVSSILIKNIGQFFYFRNIFLAKLSLSSVASQSPNAVSISRKMTCSEFTFPKKIHEFLYNETNNRYSILYQHESSSSRNIFVEIDPNMDSQVVAFRDFDVNSFFCESINLGSYDIFSNGNYAYYGACCPEDPNCKFFQYETSGHQSLCSPSVKCGLYDISVQPYYYYSQMFNLRERSNIQLKKNDYVLIKPLKEECSH